MMENTFDASKYLTNLGGREYLEVKWRLLWLRTQHPDAVIETELEKHEAGLALFRARVAVPGGGAATGWGSETADDFEDFIEKAETKALGRALAALGYGTQFCEDFNFGVADAASPRETHARRDGADAISSSAGAASGSADAASPRETQARRDGADAISSSADAASPRGGQARRDTPVVDAPVARQGLKVVRDKGRVSATPSQINAILAIGRNHQAEGEGSVEDRCRTAYGCAPAELSKQQASEFIDLLRRPATGEATVKSSGRRSQRAAVPSSSR